MQVPSWNPNETSWAGIVATKTNVSNVLRYLIWNALSHIYKQVKKIHWIGTVFLFRLQDDKIMFVWVWLLYNFLLMCLY